MSAASDQVEPVIEPKPGDQPGDRVSRALRQRIRQQELLAGLGVLALQGTSFIGMLDYTARMTAEGLGAEYCKVMEYLPSENRLLVRAGVGWGEGVVGTASVGADLESPAGYAPHTGKPAISNHLENERRFRTPELSSMLQLQANAVAERLKEASNRVNTVGRAYDRLAYTADYENNRIGEISARCNRGSSNDRATVYDHFRSGAMPAG